MVALRSDDRSAVVVTTDPMGNTSANCREWWASSPSGDEPARYQGASRSGSNGHSGRRGRVNGSAVRSLPDGPVVSMSIIS